MSARRITAAMLREHHACPGQLATFELEWPKGVVPTLAACRRALALGLDLNWAARVLMPAPALKAYDEACATAWKAYNEARAAAFARAWRGQS